MKQPLAVTVEDEADRSEGAPHPRHATTLVGHAERERDLLDAYRHNRLPHAIILGGPKGIGKATLAWRLARFLVAHPDRGARIVAEAVDLSVPPESRAAAQIASLSHPDVSLLRREVDEKRKRFFTEIRADDVRRTIGMFQRRAGAGGYRICIVDSAEDLNRTSANALLKLIEEPPPLSLFLLVAHRPGLIMPTIRSRARLIRLRSLDPAEIRAVIGTLGPPWATASDAEITAAADAANGSLPDALRRLVHRGPELDHAIRHALERLPSIDWREVHRLADQTLGRDGEAVLDAILTAAYDWIAGTVRDPAIRSPRQLSPLAETWERVSARAREAGALNLDRRPVVLATFADLASAVRAASG